MQLPVSVRETPGINHPVADVMAACHDPETTLAVKVAPPMVSVSPEHVPVGAVGPASQIQFWSMDRSSNVVEAAIHPPLSVTAVPRAGKALTLVMLKLPLATFPVNVCVACCVMLLFRGVI